jgi:coenzyme PQQ synthesis protein D (PqqD)
MPSHSVRQSRGQIITRFTICMQTHSPSRLDVSPETLHMKMRRPDLLTCIVDNEVVILDCVKGYVHQLNATASEIWKVCDGRQSVEDIVTHMTEHFADTPDTVLSDTLRTLAAFERLGLLLDERPVEHDRPASPSSKADKI